MMGEGIDVTTWKWIMELLIGLALAVGVMLRASGCRVEV